MHRHISNPIITPDMLTPTSPDFEVMGAFNAGAATVGNKTVLLLRVAERCKAEDGFISVPVYRFEGGIGRAEALRLSEDDPEVHLKDTRGVVYKGKDYLSTLSTIRAAWSDDGVLFEVDDTPLIAPLMPYEQYGCEDARVVKIGDDYFINYTGVSCDGWATALCSTRDFKSVSRKGIIFPPPNKDVCIFPERIGGKYWALHRPHNEGFGKPSIWISSSTDLINWGEHKCIVRPRDTQWEGVKIGGGASPIKTDEGWLEVYHGKGEGSVYSLFTILFDLDDPSTVIGRGQEPLLVPETEYETNGFFPNVVFTNGWVERDNGEIYLYYGASDETTNLLMTSKDELLANVGQS